MPQAFITQIEQVCRRGQRRGWMSAACLSLAAIVAMALALVGLDRVLGVADPVGRCLSTILFIVFCAYIVQRCFAKVWQRPITPLQIAHQVERQQPQFRDIVTSAWAFSQQADSDPTAGSESLRRATILRAAAAVDEIEWQQLIPRKPLRRAAFTLAGAVLAIGLLGWFIPQALGIGLTRLVNPFSTVEWPRQHDLEFIAAPKLLAAGEDLTLELRDTRGRLPDSITMHYRMHRRGHWYDEAEQLAVSNSSSLNVRRSSVQQSLEYRATGGDHNSMPWLPLEVLTPPRIESQQITIHPPAYTGLPATAWDNTLPVYAGSGLELQAQTDQPIVAAMLRGSDGVEVKAEVGADRTSFWIDSARWQVAERGLYTIELTTPQGLVSHATTQLAVEVIADQPPQVRFVEPTEDLMVVPTAVVPLLVEARDELSLRQINLVYQRSDQTGSGDQHLLLWQTTDAEGDAVRKQLVEYDWQLGGLLLATPSTLEIRAQASDAQPAVGLTRHPLRLTVVTEQELWQQLIDRQAKIVEVLSELHGTERQQLAATNTWSEFPEWAPARWTNSTHAALFRQRQITDTLAVGASSVVSQLTSIRQAISRNNLIRPEATDRLQVAQDLLQSLTIGALPQIEEQLSQITRLVQSKPSREKLAPLLAETALRQGDVIETLYQAIEVLQQGNFLAQLEKRLELLRSAQQELATECQSELAPKILNGVDLDPVLLASAVRRQRELTRQMAEIMRDMSQTADQLVDENPLVSRRLAEAVVFAGELELQAAMQAAADQLAARRVGRLSLLQQQIVEDLAKLLSRLQGQDVEDSAEQFKRLEAAERRLRRLRRDVAKLNRDLQKLTSVDQDRKLERLRREREELAQRTVEITRELERLKIPKAADAARQASEKLRSTSLEQKTTRSAQKQLDIAQQQLTDQRRRQQVALARLQMAQLDTKLRALLARQEAVREEIIRLDELQIRGNQLSEAQRESLLQLVGQQSDLRDETLAQADSLVRLPVFAHLLRTASALMEQIGERLEQADLGQTSQSLAEQTIGQLRQLAAAVRQERKNLSDSDDSNSGGAGQGDQADAPQGQTLQLALGQLQLLKTLQTALQEKTEALETQLAANQPPSQETAELARQQKELTELARQLIPEPPDPPTQEVFPNLEQELEQLLIQ